ncbi:creatininase family protein [Stagnihabitans tardus]|uniref:Creatininase family protein n=1 Tax=Stagnihabitans tardus TaxID=2699202 RepID=A0AAE4Y5Q3_9RHOB|nr:creatininase family protein [Stagnihabitans tardus]NBZ86217.1 creatininase family protein [Stagnihabitans tardus]
MRYELCTPHQLRQAQAENLPLVLALGVQEYHGEHLPLGVDLLAVTRCLDRLEAEAPDRMVILPSFAYGAASHAVAGAESFTLHLPTQAFQPLAEALFAALLKAGFRNIHGVIHHQTENFAQGMPTDLTFRLAARNAVFAHLEATRGPGWWGAKGMETYYEAHAQGENPFNWVQIHPLMPPEVAEHFPFDHAGEGETALMLALAPETVEQARMAENDTWYTASAPRASAAQGEAGVAIILAHLKGLLGL